MITRKELTRQQMNQIMNNHRTLNNKNAPTSILSNFKEPDIPPEMTKVPITNNWPGNYDFNISFVEEKSYKQTRWTYSTYLDHLFVGMGNCCPFRVSVINTVPLGSIIRIMAVYSDADSLIKPVTRCSYHIFPTGTRPGFQKCERIMPFYKRKQLLDDHPAPCHFIRTVNRYSYYQTCPISKRASVTIPYATPQAGCDYTMDLCSFMCYTSCVGGPSRRPLKLVFTLEHLGETLGRRSVNLTVCVYPFRVKSAHEKEEQNAKTVRKVASEKSIKKKRSDLLSKIAKNLRIMNEKQNKNIANEKNVG